MTAEPLHASLIVNADDFGYFRCVSKGILKCASEGIVTATGVFATVPDFAEHAAWLREAEGLDAGVHLNLTSGSPLTGDLAARLARWSGRFPGKAAAAAAVMSGAIGVEHVRVEWRAQIERCLRHGLCIRFLNSHEHIHMLPSLFRVATELAQEFGIRHVRFPTARIAWKGPFATLIRGAVVRMLEAMNGARREHAAIRFLGMERSGRLDMDYLATCVSALRLGGVYELMCHPGQYDEREVNDPLLVRYHDWEGEMRTLTDPHVREMLDRQRVRLIGYRHLESAGYGPLAQSCVA